MKRFLLPILLLAISLGCKKTNPNEPPEPEPPVTKPIVQIGLVTTDKNFPGANEALTITFNPAKGNAALSANTGDVYIHWGVVTNSSNGSWKYVKADFNTADPASKMNRQANGSYSITITPQTFFGVPAGEQILKIAMLFKNTDASMVARNADGTDIYLPIYSNGLNVRFLRPEMAPTSKPSPIQTNITVGQELEISGVASQPVNLKLTLNDVEFANAANATQITGKATITAIGEQVIKIIANGSVQESFKLTAGGAVTTAALPAGAKPNGITFLNNGSSAILALYAPQKNYVYAIGDFNNWTATANGYMKRTADGNTWWLQVDGLNPNTEYAYQFWVDGTIKIADPYTEKVLDPNHDPYIPAANYANFGIYPAGKTTGIVSTMKASQASYSWTHPTISRPAKNDLVIYELLLRDFLGTNNYQVLKDTVNYLSQLGVNAIELLPVNEFEGNNSWGYNPSFYFALDKYYGSKQMLQAFVDACHAKGIAVILDVVFNHAEGQSPMVQLYWDAANSRPAANNPWFNATAPHSAIKFGNDFNHESMATRNFVKDVLKYWMQEYRIDGYRFDFTKGFTQKITATDAAMSAKDDSRIAILKDYNNYIRSIDPNAYVILEHLCSDEEEKVLAAEGMMLWNNLNHSFTEASMGWLTNSDLNRGIFTTHGFSQADGLVSYMESHDEERMMYKNLQFGNAAGNYNIKDLNTALKRQELCAAFLFTMPGPKMIWQFGELGYDISIDHNGRTGEKPLLWDYNKQAARLALKNAFARFIALKKNNSIFKSNNIVSNLTGAVKYIKLTEGANTVVVVGNFDVNTQPASVDIGAAGTWYDVAHNSTVSLTGSHYTAALAPGEYHIFSKALLQ
ncbi:alpha-amylase family glycosyl hydrolase [Niabella yanshanensis]|uniref:Alpha-amylase family glycosyl hydrolase n=1 Tax=Niabella yanshanensis TaxID=577386 RepID=A0ABZ0WCG8_9BACT|nr:alpha-amylase family glycosyl hydrolase [Niabella yanshanensis]WQD40579.1 alpha-amylase family glycosyl hydrolase [Niabella yanshanensis]